MFGIATNIFQQVLLTLEHVPERLVGSAGVGNGRGPSK